jgi:hypothetical protein
MLVFGARVDRDGPLWDGRAHAAAQEYTDEVEQTIAEVGVHKVRAHFARFVQNPTPYYELNIRADRAFDGWEVHDQGIVYGPWLAGVGSRNRTSRFKGYPHWQLGTADLRADAQGIAEYVLDQYLPRMGG